MNLENERILLFKHEPILKNAKIFSLKKIRSTNTDSLQSVRNVTLQRTLSPTQNLHTIHQNSQFIPKKHNLKVSTVFMKIKKKMKDDTKL